MAEKLADTSEIKTYSLGVHIKDIYKEINELIKENIKNNTLPYVQDVPLPQDMDIVSGKHLGDVNKVQLELKAAAIGAKSLKWIYGANAALIGLELKKQGIDTEPIVVLANTRRQLSATTSDVAHTSNIAAEGLKTEAQTVYLLDQFTPESIERALKQSSIEQHLDLRGNDVAQKQKRIIAKRMIQNIAEYDSGLIEKDLREDKRKNLKENFKTPEINVKVNDAYKNMTRDYTPQEKAVFNMLFSYYAKQEAGVIMKNYTDLDKQKFLKCLWTMANENTPELAKTVSQSVLFTDRATQYQFSFDRIYNSKDVDQRSNVYAPNAAKFEQQPESLLSVRTAEKLRQREREFKPRQITHQRGF